MTTKPALQKILNGILNTEEKEERRMQTRKNGGKTH
jgi:hypothetical protein